MPRAVWLHPENPGKWLVCYSSRIAIPAFGRPPQSFYETARGRGRGVVHFPRALHRPAGRPQCRVSATRPLPWIIIAVVIALAQVVTRSLAVSGAQPTDPGEDFQAYSVRYHNCLFKCDRTAARTSRTAARCSRTAGASPRVHATAPLSRAHIPEFSLPMRLAGWDCASDCKFRCMQSTMALRAVEGLRPAKYYGKWSFHRVLGMQEIISSLASVANAAVHVRYLPELLRVSLDRVRPSPARNRARLWLVNAVVNVNGWTWSAVFHARDTPRTHFMDYASANAIFFFALFAVLVRVWGRRGGRLRWPLAAAFCLWFAAPRPRDERARRRVEVSVRAQHAGDDGRRGRALVAAAVVGLPSRVGKEIVGAASGR